MDRMQERRVTFIDKYITNIMKLLSDELYAGRIQLVEDRKSNYLGIFKFNFGFVWGIDCENFNLKCLPRWNSRGRRRKFRKLTAG